MESKDETQFSEVFVSDIKVEHDSDALNYENEKKWNADPLTEETVTNEVHMPIIKKEEVNFEPLECSDDQLTTKLEEECLTESNNEAHIAAALLKAEQIKSGERKSQETTLKAPKRKLFADVTRLSSGLLSPCTNSSSNINPTVENSKHELLRQLLSNMSDVSNSEETSQNINTKYCQKERPYKCSFCDKSFTLKGNLSRHERTHTNQRTYTCDICNKSFTESGNLIAHLHTHSNERPYTCSTCNMSFRERRSLSRHLRTHTNERPYTCSVCKKSFTQSGILSSHMRTHTNDRPYMCNVCNKCFTQSGHLSRHQRTHTNDRPYVCDICSKSFTQSGNLITHLRTHTNERPYTCGTCNKSFTERGSLGRHQRTHTN